MSSDTEEKRYFSTEIASPSFPCMATTNNDQNLDAKMTELSLGSGPVEHKEEEENKKEVAYLRESDLYTLYPAFVHKPWQDERRKKEGSAHQFLTKLGEAISKRNTDKRREEIHLAEIRRYLTSHGMADVVEKIKSEQDMRNLPGSIGIKFRHKDWYFNCDLNHEAADEYQLLSLKCPLNRNEIIPHLWDLSEVGNTLEADLQYQEFFSKLFQVLEWDDTEEEGVKKTIEIRDQYFLDMNDRVFPWVLEDWATYKLERYMYTDRINLLCDLWVGVEEEKGDFSDLSADDYVRRDFEKMKEYVKKSSLCGSKRSTRLLIKEYCEATKPVPEPDGGDYLLYVKEKIRMALKLGIIQKEDVVKSEAGSQLLKTIERYDPRYFECGVP